MICVNYRRVNRSRLKREMERFSRRYGSIPVDGPAKGEEIMAGWDKMAANFYNEIGWDFETGKPYAETLQKLGLEHLVDDMTTKIKKHLGDIFYYGLVTFS